MQLVPSNGTASAFRQLDVLESVGETGLFEGLPKVDAWRRALAARTSVREAVPENFADLYLSRLRGNDAQILKREA